MKNIIKSFLSFSLYLAISVVIILLLWNIIQISNIANSQIKFFDDNNNSLPVSNDIIIVSIENDKEIEGILTKISEQAPQIIGINSTYENLDESEIVTITNTLNNIESPVIISDYINNDTYINNILYGKVNSELVTFGFININDYSNKRFNSITISNVSNNECHLNFSILASTNKLNLDKTNLCNNNITDAPPYFLIEKPNGGINYIYTDNKFTTITANDIGGNNYPKNFFANKIVIIGSISTDTINSNQIVYRPDQSKVSLTVAHANVINSLIHSYLIDSSKYISITTSLLLLLLSISLLYYCNPFSTFDILILTCSYAISNYFIYHTYKLQSVIPYISVNLALIMLFGLSKVYKYYKQRLKYNIVTTAFKQYIYPLLLGKIKNNPKSLSLGGKMQNITILFCDIRHFTTIAEKLNPEELLKLLNDYLQDMSEIIIENNGTIDKYIGDCIMAVWNTQSNIKDHNIKAIKTVVEMVSSLEGFNQKHPNTPKIEMGIGLNTGEAIVSNIGCERHFDYTVLGDTVNLASRLETLTKHYQVSSLINSSCIPKNGKIVLNSKTEILFRHVDTVKVKGKLLYTSIYQPYIKSAKNMKLNNDYKIAFNYYKHGDFKEAMTILKKHQDTDTLSRIMWERCKKLRKLKNIKSWNGIWNWDEK